MPKKAAQKNANSLSERQRRIYDFLQAIRTGVLATVNPDGEPHGTVIYHAVDKQLAVSFLTRAGTKIYDNLVKNNHVALVVFEPQSQKVVQVIGKAVGVTDGYGINEVAEAVFTATLKTSQSGMPPLVKLDSGEYAAFRIKPDQVRMASYAQPDTDNYHKIFESVESFELRGGD